MTTIGPIELDYQNLTKVIQGKDGLVILQGIKNSKLKPISNSECNIKMDSNLLLQVTNFEVHSLNNQQEWQPKHHSSDI